MVWHLSEFSSGEIAKTVKTGQECMLELSVEMGVKCGLGVGGMVKQYCYYEFMRRETGQEGGNRLLHQLSEPTAKI